MIKLNASAIPGFAYYQFLSGNNDIRFAADDGSLLSHEIDTWNTSSDSFIWVRVPVLVTNTTIRMFYAKAGESANWRGVHPSCKFKPKRPTSSSTGHCFGSNPGPCKVFT
jgi:hypothetical protein